jgi:hypothetical protein
MKIALAAAATIVENTSQLETALASAKSGDVILLAANDAGYTLNGQGYASGLTIASLNAAAPARFNEAILRGVVDMTISGVSFSAAPGAGKLIGLEIFGATNLVVENSTFTGPARSFLSVDTPYGGRAVSARDADGLTFRDNVVSNLTYGFDIHKSSDVALVGNDILRIQADGVRMSEVQGVRIADNVFAEFYGANSKRAHADYIQFWTRNTSVQTRDVVIEGNLILADGSRTAQGIFMNNERVANFGAGAYDMRYENVAIRDNLIINDAANTVYVHGAKGLNVSGNILLNKLDPSLRKAGEEPTIRVVAHSQDATVSDNVAPRIVTQSAPGVAVSGNQTRPGGVTEDKALALAQAWAEETRFVDSLTRAGLYGAEHMPETPAAERVGDTGVVVITQTNATKWTWVSFEAPIKDAVVVAGPASFNGADPVTVRVRGVTETGFEIKIDEWDYLDGKHVLETVGWVAIQAGRHELRNGLVIEAQSAHGDTAWTGQKFESRHDGTPVVFAQAASYEDAAAVTTRLRSVSADGFQFRLQEEERADDRHAVERVDWIAVSQGAGSGFAAGVTKTVVTDRGHVIDYGVDHSLGAGAFLADMQTFNGADTATVRLGKRGVGAATVFIEEERSADAEMKHAAEAVGWLMLTDDALLL